MGEEEGLVDEMRSLKRGVTVWKSGWNGPGTNRRFSSSQEALAFGIGSTWGRRVEYNEEGMLFIMEKKGSYKMTDRLGDCLVWPVDLRSLLGMQWE